MSGQTQSAEAESRFLESGDEAGTAPGDRKFRPDVEGLRAVAIVLVVLFHAGVPGSPVDSWGWTSSLFGGAPHRTVARSGHF